MTFAAAQRAGRATFLSAAIATFSAGAVLLWSPTALAAAGCTTTSSSGVRTIVCDAAGTDTIDVPSGANSATVVVIGGGGGSGQAIWTSTSGAGGNGGKVSATLDVSAVASLGVTVGAGGSGSAGFVMNGGGFGGGYSLIQIGTSPAVIAGGGGGGGNESNLVVGPGGDGGSGTATGAAVGGSGGPGPTGYTGGGVGGNDDGLGSGGISSSPGNSGIPWSGGGGGGTPDQQFGGGGGGYGGGGSGTGYAVLVGGTGGGAGGSFADRTLASDVVFEPLPAAPGDVTAGAGGASVSNGNGNGGQDGSIIITFVLPTTPLDPSQGSTSTGATRSVSLNFTLPSAMSCDFGSLESGLGSWMQLPKASDCTVTTRASSNAPSLLGWATTANFPVGIAQRQVDNGWGAYETFNDDGQITGVFIPAGGSTLITNDTNLYPIWSE